MVSIKLFRTASAKQRKPMTKHKNNNIKQAKQNKTKQNKKQKEVCSVLRLRQSGNRRTTEAKNPLS